MRAKEFISENQMAAWHKQGIAGLKSLVGVDQYYDIYRFGLAMAAAGNPDNPVLGDPTHGVSEENPTTLSYTDVDEKIINDALRMTGTTATQITPRKSREPTDTYTKSPVGVRKPLPRRP